MSHPESIGLIHRGTRSTGRPERHLLRLARSLQEQGSRPVIFTSAAWDDLPEDLQPVHRLTGETTSTWADAIKGLNPRQFCDRIVSFERVRDCDFYVAHDGLTQAWLDRQAQFASHLRAALDPIRTQHRSMMKLDRHLFDPDRPTRIIAPSEWVKFEIQQHHGKPASQIDVVYPGCKPPAVRAHARSEVRNALGLSDRDVMVLFAAPDWLKGGLPFAIRAVRELGLPNVRLVVIGSGHSVFMPRGPVTYAGDVRKPNDYFEAADLFLVPSVYEPFSESSLLAAAHGVPVITTTSNGFAELMIHGHQGGVVEDPSDIEALVVQLRKWTSEELRQSTREAIRSWSHHFHLSESTKQLVRAIFKADPAELPT